MGWADRNGEAADGTLQVGDGAGHLDDTEICPHRQPQPLHNRDQQFTALPVEGTVSFYLLVVHLGIGEYWLPLESPLLDCPRRSHSPGHFRAAFAFDAFRLDAGEFRRPETGHEQLQVDTVHNRAAQARDIGEALRRSAGTPVPDAPIAAGAGIGCQHEHKRSGVFHLGLEPGNHDFPVFYRPSESLHHAARHLRGLVQEQHSVLRQAHFSGHYVVTGTAPDDCGKGGRIVRGAEGPAVHKPRTEAPLPGDAENLRSHQALLPRHRRKDAAKCLCQ